MERTAGLGANGFVLGESPPIVMVTAYDAISANIAEEAGVDIILVGDSAATTILGYETTRAVSVGEMLMLTRAARRGAPNTVILGDLPFGSYERSNHEAVEAAWQFLDAGADLVKLEGAGVMAQRLRSIVDAGVPAVGHVGLLPQGARNADELRARGRSAEEALRIVNDAIELDHAGASLIVVEAVPSVVARAVQDRVRVPVIGIGAGSAIGGQVLVYPDMVGLTTGKVPRFVRQYASLRETWTNAVRTYGDDVRARAFPSGAEEYGMPAEESSRFEQLLRERHPSSGS
jgi:3-methyl-2-oxobutanoate hydroxymethyltransferase